MYKLFLLFIFLSAKTYGAAAFSTEPDAAASASASSKPVSATETGTVIHETAGHIPYYFRADPVTEDFIENLKEYQAAEKKLFSAYSEDLLPGLSAEDRKKKETIIGSCERVLDDLVKYASIHYSRTDTWIMSVIRKEDEAPLMRVCAKTCSRSKFTHHIGICQSFARFVSDDTPKGLSLILHGFAADFMIKRESKRESGYMITTPTKIMDDILSETLGGCYTKSKLGHGREGFYIELHARSRAKFIVDIVMLDKENDSWIHDLHLRDKASSLKALQKKFLEALAAPA